MDNYLINFVAGKTLSMWLQEFSPEMQTRNKVAWTLIHICLSFYFIFGDPWITGSDFDHLSALVDKFYPGIEESIGDEPLIYYLFHFVVGKYGHLDATETYVAYVQDLLGDIFSNVDSVAELPMNPSHTAIPMPGNNPPPSPNHIAPPYPNGI